MGLLLRFGIDTNFIGDASDAARRLRALEHEGWIALEQSDTVVSELERTEPGLRKILLREAASTGNVYFGPMVLGHSRLDSSVLASPDDDERIDAVFRVLFPDSERRGRKMRDAMHVAAAMRYGMDGFVTRDKRDLLRKAPVIRAAFNDFPIMSPKAALAFAERMVERARFRGDTSQ